MKKDDLIVALRRTNLRKIIEDIKKQDIVSSDAALAEKYEIKGGASYLSQLMNGHGSFGEKAARKLEANLQLEKFYLDKEHDNQATQDQNSPTITPKDEVYISPIRFNPSDENKNTVRIPVHKDVKASCGDGVANFLEEITDYLDIDPNILKLLGIKANPKNLRVIYSAEYSMWPTVAPDSPLFVDISSVDASSIINGDVYVFIHGGLLRMKRIFISIVNETVRLQSDNPDKNKYPDEVITKEQLNELSFVGRLESALVKP